MIKCPAGRFGNDDATTERIGILNYYMCPSDDFNFTMSRKFFFRRSLIFKYLG